MTKNLRPKLKDITICAVDCQYPLLAAQALTHSNDLCEFNRVILFTDSNCESVSNCETIKIDQISSINEYSYFILKKLNEYISTDFALLIQWDGFVTNPDSWSEDFKNFDYIGAKWEWHKDGKNIGNGGFSLRSKKLLEATHSDSFVFISDDPEDNQICRTYHNFLKTNNQIAFATEEMADIFSYERTLPNYPTFGFHGLFNIWRHYTDEQVAQLILQLNPKTLNSRELLELWLQYFLLRKFILIKLIYQKVKSINTIEELKTRVSPYSNDKNFPEFFLNICEKL